MTKIKNILIVGGTHGNEMTGIHLVKQWQNNNELVKRSDLSIKLLLANFEAIKKVRRYVEFDLNRAFSTNILQSEDSLYAENAEILRAKQINAEYGPKGEHSKTDLCIDIHNSTANMGVSLILNHIESPMKRICAILAQEFPQVRILYQPESEATLPYLPTLAKRDLTIEVGPQAHGTILSSLYTLTEKVIYRLLDLIVEWNSGVLPQTPVEIPVFTQEGVIDYPRGANGEIQAMIHPSLEGKDYLALEPGAPVFLSFAGEEILWNESQTIWPCFIGEAAYLEKRIAFCKLIRKQELW